MADGGQNCLPGEPDPPAPLVTADDIPVAHTPGCGLPRPTAATPLELAPRLEEHFGSPVPGEISQAFGEARYGRRPRRRTEVERLRSRWEEDARRAP